MQNASRREILAWSMYDFANSAFTTTITAVVFQAYFVGKVVPKDGVSLLGMSLKGPALWSVAYGTSMAISAAIAPFIGAVCDYSAGKKRWLVIFWLLGSAATVALATVGPGMWLLGSLLYIVGNVAFESSVSLNSAFLPELAPPEKLDRISSIGWGIGYLGGGLCLFLNLLMIQKPEIFGIPPSRNVAFALGSVGAWWLLFGLPCILGVKERSTGRPLPPGRRLATAGFLKTIATLRSLKRFPTLARLAVAVLVFLAGVNTVLAMATSFAADQLKFGQEELIQCFLMIQVVAGVGALTTAALTSRIQTKKALVVMLVVWIAALAWAAIMNTRLEFWLLGAVIGFVMGGTQALARGMQAQLTPPSATAEFFGFYAVTQKMAAAGASFLFAAASWAAGVQAGIASMILLFLLGLWLLWPVDAARGLAESREEEGRLQAGGAA